MLNQPTSSPMMTRMLGFAAPCACANAGGDTRAPAASVAANAFRTSLFIWILRLGLTRLATVIRRASSPMDEAMPFAKGLLAKRGAARRAILNECRARTQVSDCDFLARVATQGLA